MKGDGFLEKLYTVSDVAQMTGLTERTIRNYIKDGKLRGKKVGVQWRFTEEDIGNLFQDPSVSGEVMENNHEKVTRFIKQKPIAETGAIIINEAVEDEKELEKKVEKIIDFVNQNKNFRFSYQYFKEDKIAQFILIGNIKTIGEFMEKRG
mgnify:FL=1